MKNKPKKGKKYTIRYKGYYEYDSYDGEGIFTGKSKDIEGICYEFIIDDGTTGLFPLKDIFEYEKKMYRM